MPVDAKTKARRRMDSFEREEAWKEFMRSRHIPTDSGVAYTSSIEYELFRELMVHNSHALIAATPDGEDAAGRQKLRLQTPQELVSRCEQIAGIAAVAIRHNRWLKETPVAEVYAEFERFAEEHSRLKEEPAE